MSRFIYSNTVLSGKLILSAGIASLNRALFVWVTADSGQDPLVTSETQNELINFSTDHEVNIIYLDMYQYLGSSNWSAGHVTSVQNLIASATAANIEVWALAGNTDWTTLAVQGWVDTNITQHIVDYNLASSDAQKFSGFMLDAEYWTDVGQTATDGLNGLCVLITDMQTSLGLPVGTFTPFYFMDDSRPDVLFNENTKQEGAHLMDVADAVVVGAYRRYAEPFSDQNGQIQLMQPWIDYTAGTADLYCGAETVDVGDVNVSYLGASYTEFETEQDLIISEFEAIEHFKGIAIHSYDGFKNLIE